VSTEYIENEGPGAAPTYRAYYPTRETLHETLVRMRPQLPARSAPSTTRRATSARVVEAAAAPHGACRWRTGSCAPTSRSRCCRSLFYRNKGAYLVGKVINGYTELPMCLPILHGHGGRLVIDTALFGEDELLMVFSFARAYFMVDMEVPSACVQFLRSLMPRKPRAEALQRPRACRSTARTSSTGTCMAHLRHSADRFRIARASRAW
jgi:isocitrate dehydrogenase kinase/phosphatase